MRQVVATFIFGLTSALAIWLAVREVFGARLADRTVLLYVFCPVAYVLSLAYTEGLFLTAAAACLFALSRRYWVSAALCACLAGLTRNTGIVLVAGRGGDGAPGRMARAHDDVPPWRRPSRRSGLSRSWRTAGRRSARPWPS